MIVLTQLLCPKKHCFFGIAVDAAEVQERQDAVELLFKIGIFNRHCGICGSADLKWVSRDTGAATIEEIKPLLKAMEAEQMKTRAYLDLQGMTEDSKRFRGN